MPRSSSSSTTSFYNSDNASRSVTSTAYTKGYGNYMPVDFPASDELVEPVDPERSSGDSISVTIRFRPLR